MKTSKIRPILDYYRFHGKSELQTFLNFHTVYLSTSLVIGRRFDRNFSIVTTMLMLDETRMKYLANLSSSNSGMPLMMYKKVNFMTVMELKMSPPLRSEQNLNMMPIRHTQIGIGPNQRRKRSEPGTKIIWQIT